MPLHRPRTGLPTYYQQLTYCVAQYLEKDRSATAPIIVACLCRCWPWCSSSKQVRRGGSRKEGAAEAVPFGWTAKC